MKESTSMVFRILGVGVLLLVACSSSSSSPPVDSGAPLNHGIGEPCPNGNGDCASGLLCAGEDPGGGQCFKQCAASKDTDCGDTTLYACSFEGHCYLRCKVTADCPRAAQGYVCKDDTPARAGVRFCDVAI